MLLVTLILCCIFVKVWPVDNSWVKKSSALYVIILSWAVSHHLFHTNHRLQKFGSWIFRTETQNYKMIILIKLQLFISQNNIIMHICLARRYLPQIWWIVYVCSGIVKTRQMFASLNYWHNSLIAWTPSSQVLYIHRVKPCKGNVPVACGYGRDRLMLAICIQPHSP